MLTEPMRVCGHKKPLWLSRQLYALLFALGKDICPHCGNQQVTPHGWRGYNFRVTCEECGATSCEC